MVSYDCLNNETMPETRSEKHDNINRYANKEGKIEVSTKNWVMLTAREMVSPIKELLNQLMKH